MIAAVNKFLPSISAKPHCTWSADFGRAYVLDLAALKGTAEWENIFATHKKKHQQLEIIDETITQDFTYKYLVMEDLNGRVRCIQPFFLLRQDLLAGKGRAVKRVMDAIHVFLPRFMTLQTLMVGSTVGEGVLGVCPDDAEWCSQALLSILMRCAAKFKASLIVMKEFPHYLRPILSRFVEKGYARIPSMPYTVLDLSCSNFEEFMRTKLSHAYRKNLRRKFKKTEGLPITMEVVTDITPLIDELYPLYLQVYERSALHFEKLTKEYLCRLGTAQSSTTRFFIWRQSGRAIAFSICSLHDNALWDEYLGMDYELALDLHLYFTTFRDLFNWCCSNGINRYYSTALNYDPKLHLKFMLMPMDLYVRLTNKFLNRIFRLALPLLDPTRNDAVLKKYPNVCEL
jgi:hypothetical protein